MFSSSYQSTIASIFFRSILICPSLIINPIKSIFLIKNLHFSIATSIYSSYSLFKTYLTYSLYSSLLIKQIIILLRYTITNLSRYSPNTLLIRFQNITSAFISLNCITVMGLAQLQQECLGKTLNRIHVYQNPRLLESMSTRIYVYQNPRLLESTSTRIHVYQNPRPLESTSTRIHAHQNPRPLFSTNAITRSIESYQRPSKTACVRTHVSTTKTSNYLFISLSYIPFIFFI